MAVTAKQLDVSLGDVVEIDGRKYDIVSDKAGGVALEPAIFANELDAREGTRPIRQEEFADLFGDRGDARLPVG